jgi:beta-glucosidase
VKAVTGIRKRTAAGIAMMMMAGTAMTSLDRSAMAREPAEAQTDQQVATRVERLLEQMTVEEKAGQLSDLFVFAQYPTMVKAAERNIAAGKVGALLFVTDPIEINRLQRIAMEQSRLKIPLLFGFDVIHGLRTIFPVPIANAASWDPAGVERAQAVAAREARAVGIHWTFAPMVDIARDGRWGRIVEGAGEDPYLGSAMAAAQVRGFQGARIGAPDHVIAGPKHFVGYGAATGGRDYEEVDLSDEALWNVYLPPFKAAIDAGAGNIMSAYMPVNGIPASGNRHLLTDVLRDGLGFKGFVVSDAGAVENLRTHGFAVDYADAAARALDAGVDMEMTSSSPKSTLLPAAIAAGKVSMAQLDQAVRRVLTAKIRMGLFEHPYVDAGAAAKVLGARRHLAEAQGAAERAAVLLRNEGGILPLTRATVKRIAVIGGLAASAADALGPWVFKQNQPVASTVLDGIRAKAGPGISVTYARGVAIPPRRFASPFANISVAPPADVPVDETAAIAEAVAAARAADVAIVVVGERQDMAGEAASTSTFDLPGGQQAMLDAVVATGKPVVAILMNGRPLDLKDTRAAAILDIWYPGSAAGAATANLLFGDAVPGGKLPFTWPRNAAQVPLYYNHLRSHDPANAGRRYWNEPSTPAYPFGYGLSYTRFTYGEARVDKAAIARGESVKVSVEVANTGTRRADEVAQLYIHQRSGTQARPVRELKGFQRVTLAPGERRTLRFVLTPSELRYWNAAKRDWVIDAAMFDYAVGGDSEVKFAGKFEVR